MPPKQGLSGYYMCMLQECATSVYCGQTFVLGASHVLVSNCHDNLGYLFEDKEPRPVAFSSKSPQLRGNSGGVGAGRAENSRGSPGNLSEGALESKQAVI